jgi:hypothetical protein
LLPDFAMRGDVVGVADIEFVDLISRDELLDFDGAFALDGDGFQLVGRNFNVVILGDFVALDDIRLLDVVAGLGINFLVADAVANFFVQLMKADLLEIERCRFVPLGANYDTLGRSGDS